MVFGHYVEIAASAGAGQLVAEGVVVYQLGHAAHVGGVGAAVYGLVLRPRLAHEAAHLAEVGALYGLVHLERMLLHLAQAAQLVALVEEHAAHYLGQYALSRARYAGII